LSNNSDFEIECEHESANESEDNTQKPIHFIYKNSTTTIKDLAWSLLSFKYMHKLSDIALDDMLNLISLLLPENKLPKTSRKLLGCLDIENYAIDHVYCVKCKLISLDDSSKRCITCANELIKFSTYEIIPQLEKILSNESYLAQIKAANKTRDLNRTSIIDALDGGIYSAVEKKEGILNVSLNINTDGAPLIKSRNHALWPVPSTILELNQSSREKIDNTIMCGMWLHNSKPPNTFFEKSFEKIRELIGKETLISNHKIRLRCHVGLFDLPAKAAIANIKQFNGAYGCPCCLHPGKQVARVRLYPPDERVIASDYIIN